MRDDGVIQLADISIHSPHARGDLFLILCGLLLAISIHSPHARGDRAAYERRIEQLISIHSPHARGDGRREAWTRGR